MSFAVQTAFHNSHFQAEEEAAAAQFQVNLPMLVVGSQELAPTVVSLAASLPPAMQLLTKDVGE